MLQTIVCIATIATVQRHGRPSISITLSPAQVEEVMKAASLNETPTVSSLITAALTGALQGSRLAAASASREDDDGDGEEVAIGNGHSSRRLSRSLLRGLSILTCFDADREERGIVEIAKELGMSASTTHRYALTLVELGLLERCPHSRKYRLPARSS